MCHDYIYPNPFSWALTLTILCIIIIMCHDSIYPNPFSWALALTSRKLYFKKTIFYFISNKQKTIYNNNLHCIYIPVHVIWKWCANHTFILLMLWSNIEAYVQNEHFNNLLYNFWNFTITDQAERRSMLPACNLTWWWSINKTKQNDLCSFK